MREKSLCQKTPKRPFGRPVDEEYEKQFMSKIRGDKLQAVDAECELEICLASKTKKDPSLKKKKPQRGRKKVQNKGEEKDLEALLLEIGIMEFDASRREMLFHMFKEFSQAWKFQQLDQNGPLPDYFFEDGFDLSYILYELQKTGMPQFEQFNAQDLIFLELLCLQGRGLLTEDIIKQYDTPKNMNYMILAMNKGLQKIKDKLKTYQAEIYERQERMRNEEEIQIENQSQQFHVQSKQQKKVKTKKIKKGAKGKKTKQDSDNQQDAKKEAQTQINYPEEKELALKTCNYIAWAYWYIIKKP